MRNDALSEAGLTICAVFVDLNGVASGNALLVLVDEALSLFIVFVLEFTNSLINNMLIQMIVICTF